MGSKHIEINIYGGDIYFGTLFSSALFEGNEILSVKSKSAQDLLYAQFENELFIIRDNVSLISNNGVMSLMIEFANQIPLNLAKEKFFELDKTYFSDGVKDKKLMIKDYMQTSHFDVFNLNGYIEVFTSYYYEDSKLILSDINGRNIETVNNVQGYNKLNLSDFNIMAGIYLVTYISNGTVQTEKIFISQ